jgi:hypothetical protein
MEVLERVMDEKVARRQFLKVAGAGVAGSTGLGMLKSPKLWAASAETNPYESKLPRLFSGCCAYSYGPDLKSGQMTYEDFSS